MRFIKFLLASLLGLFLVIFPVLAQDFPQPVGHVNDFAGILSSGFRESLEGDLAGFENETTAEIAVVTIGSLEGNSLEDYAVRLFEDWKIGKKEKDNGILILIAKEERKIRIEVGYGLEPIITDGRAGRIIREEMQAPFREENYDEGVKSAVEKIQEYIRSGEPPPEVSGEAIKKFGRVASFTSLLFLFMGILSVYCVAFLARSKSYYAGGIVGGILGTIFGVIIGGLAAVIFSALGFGLFGLILDYILSQNYKKLKKKGKSTSFFSSWGGFSSRGGGGGGFGGFGGGSSGGGGASGGW